MADEDKQFEASQQKLEKARKEGSVVKSKDFSTAVSLLVVFIGIFQLAPFIWDQITKLFTLLYQQIPNAHIETIGLSYILFLAAVPLLLIIGPVLLLAWFMAIITDLIQVGPLFTTKPLEPSFEKLNPSKYFKNLTTLKMLLSNILY